MSEIGPRVADLATPVLVVDRDRLQANIEAMAEFMAGSHVALRPHFKTSKMIEVAQRQRASGAVGFTCATPAEASALLDAGIDDIFWANNPAGPEKSAAAAELNQRGTVAVGVDSMALGSALQAAAVAQSNQIPYLIEVDTGLGRTGVAVDRALELAVQLRELDHLQLRGVYTHEGQLAGMRDGRRKLRAAGRLAGETLVAVADRLRAAGLEIARVSVGSTPGWDSAAAVPGVTEARPGTYVFFDANQLRLGSCVVEACALVLHTTVVSTAPGHAVIDAGVKAMSSDRSNGDDSLGLVLDTSSRPRYDLTFATAFEEHGLLRGPGTARLKVGDRLQILPNHACGITNMWSRVHVVKNGRVTDVWRTVARH